MSRMNLTWVSLMMVLLMNSIAFGKNNRHSSSSDEEEHTDYGRVKYEIQFNGFDNKDCDLQTYVDLNECDVYAIESFERACTQMGINFDGTYYASQALNGYFITKIDGLEADFANSLSWRLYINDELANFGISLLEISDGDVIRWSYESYA